jgi:hypothetical protein
MNSYIDTSSTLFFLNSLYELHLSLQENNDDDEEYLIGCDLVELSSLEYSSCSDNEDDYFNGYYICTEEEAAKDAAEEEACYQEYLEEINSFEHRAELYKERMRRRM